ncbi:MAG: hypothetical protein KatS3mg057_2028 [Herpetosiphonaceae bacterium]|nr:MAG: hypothetical protein KatS3mg057_2028 [Herpetosiphonaceae bacterium]
MHFAVFGSTDEAGFTPDWTDEEVIVLFGDANLDLTKRSPGFDAALTVLALFGSAKITVPPGSRVTVNGLSVFGDRKVDVLPADGPVIHMTLTTLFGSVRVVEAKPELAHTA